MKDVQHNLIPNYILYLGHELLNDTAISKTPIQEKRKIICAWWNKYQLYHLSESGGIPMKLKKRR